MFVFCGVLSYLLRFGFLLSGLFVIYEYGVEPCLFWFVGFGCLIAVR